MTAQPATDRHQRGRAYLASVVSWWMKESQLSHNELSCICSWGLGQPGWLDGSQISRLRNAKVGRGASATLLDGLHAANLAMHAWQTLGREQAQRELGPYAAWEVRSEWLDSCRWLGLTEAATKPLTYGHWAEINAGYLSLPYLPSLVLSRHESRGLSLQLCTLLNELAPAGPPVKAVAALVEAYPSEDEKRRERLRGLLLGLTDWTEEELRQEIHNLAALVSQLRQQDCTPGDLLEELRERRRQSG